MISSLQIVEIIQRITENSIGIDPHSPLVGSGSLIDSMGLVQICIALEERSQEDGFTFDWTSEKAMSSLNSIFKSPESLAAEYNRQYSIVNQ